MERSIPLSRPAKSGSATTVKSSSRSRLGASLKTPRLGLDKWMSAVWMIANCKNGISSYELGKNLGIRQNSAWFMLHRIREAMKGRKCLRLVGGLRVARSKSTRHLSAPIQGRCTRTSAVQAEGSRQSWSASRVWECLTVTAAKFALRLCRTSSGRLFRMPSSTISRVVHGLYRWHLVYDRLAAQRLCS